MVPPEMRINGCNRTHPLQAGTAAEPDGVLKAVECKRMPIRLAQLDGELGGGKAREASDSAGVKYGTGSQRVRMLGLTRGQVLFHNFRM